MGKFLGFGQGVGQSTNIPNSGVINTYAAVTATAGQRTVNTGLSVSAGDWVLLHQTQGGSTPGIHELVVVDTPGVGSFTARSNLDNAYVSGAQAVKVPRYSSGQFTGTLTADAWDGSKGGILSFAYSGKLKPTGTMNVDGLGFRGASGLSGQNVGRQGEGSSGPGGTQSISANGNGGGGGGYSTNNPWNQGNGAGGGGNGSVGATGRGTGGGQNQGGGPGLGGNAVGDTDGLIATLGGAGGSGGVGPGDSGTSGNGGNGAGLIILYVFDLDMSNGLITADGNLGSGAVYPLGCGGGGAGGTIIIYTVKAVKGTNNIRARGARGGCVDGNCNDRVDGRGGPGSGGRVIVRACSTSGTADVSGASYTGFSQPDTNPTSNIGVTNDVKGGHSFCGSGVQIQ